jgi:inward rectifier potassium channel
MSAPETASPPKTSPAPALFGSGRWITSTGQSRVRRLGLRRSVWQDLYHQWLSARWRVVFLAVLVLYLGVNALFAAAYLACGDGIENAQAGSLRDAFFFSVQTLATIGYGKMVPVSLAANLVVTVEALVGLVGAAMITGLMFAKFSRPTARVLWSDKIVVAPQDGVPSLMFRMANERGNQVVEANLRFTMIRAERTVEGESVRRVHDLKLQRSQSGVFVLSWMAIHRITPDSPLHGCSLEELREAGTEFLASLSGLDETFAQTIHSRKAWGMDDLAPGHRFHDLIRQDESGDRVMDYSRFHLLRPTGEAESAAVAQVLPHRRG